MSENKIAELESEPIKLEFFDCQFCNFAYSILYIIKYDDYNQAIKTGLHNEFYCPFCGYKTYKPEKLYKNATKFIKDFYDKINEEYFNEYKEYFIKDNLSIHEQTAYILLINITETKKMLHRIDIDFGTTVSAIVNNVIYKDIRNESALNYLIMKKLFYNVENKSIKEYIDKLNIFNINLTENELYVQLSN